jgi:ribosome-associated heat shock protein Hsp15
MTAAGDESPGSASQRLDKWLWFARVVKSRTLAAGLIEAGRVRVNKIKVEKPAHTVKPGDVVTSAIKKDVRVLRVRAAGVRRGPASEAALLYEDLTEKPAAADRSRAPIAQITGLRAPGAGRPTKRDRRNIDRLQGSD